MALLARSCVCPGSIALLTNLISTFDAPANLYPQGKPFWGTAHKQRPYALGPANERTWRDEYMYGGLHGMYHLVLPAQLHGLSFGEAAYAIYTQLDMTMFAMRRPEEGGDGGDGGDGGEEPGSESSPFVQPQVDAGGQPGQPGQREFRTKCMLNPVRMRAHARTHAHAHKHTSTHAHTH